MTVGIEFELWYYTRTDGEAQANVVELTREAALPTLPFEGLQIELASLRDPEANDVSCRLAGDVLTVWEVWYHEDGRRLSARVHAEHDPQIGEDDARRLVSALMTHYGFYGKFWLEPDEIGYDDRPTPEGGHWSTGSRCSEPTPSLGYRSADGARLPMCEAVLRLTLGYTSEDDVRRSPTLEKALKVPAPPLPGLVVELVMQELSERDAARLGEHYFLSGGAVPTLQCVRGVLCGGLEGPVVLLAGCDYGRQRREAFEAHLEVYTLGLGFALRAP
ncbi:MAG TPA: hypothetical protein VGN26_23695 [Armatimonadota bacterium]|jgi:hypothetical protein